MRDWLDYARGLLAGLLPLGAGLLGAATADAAEPLVRKAWLVSQLDKPHLEHFHADWKLRSDVRPMKLLAKFELERFQSG